MKTKDAFEPKLLNETSAKFSKENDDYLLAIDTGYNQLKLLHRAFSKRDWGELIGRTNRRMTLSDVHAIKRKLSHIAKENVLINERDIRNARDGEEKYRLFFTAIPHTFEMMVFGVVATLSLGDYFANDVPLASKVATAIGDGIDVGLRGIGNAFAFFGADSVASALESLAAWDNGFTTPTGATAIVAGGSSAMAWQQWRYLKSISSAVTLLNMIDAYEKMETNKINYKRNVLQKLWDTLTKKSATDVERMVKAKAARTAKKMERRFQNELRGMPEYIEYVEEGKVKRMHATELFNW